MGRPVRVTPSYLVDKNENVSSRKWWVLDTRVRADTKKRERERKEKDEDEDEDEAEETSEY